MKQWIAYFEGEARELNRLANDMGEFGRNCMNHEAIIRNLLDKPEVKQVMENLAAYDRGEKEIDTSRIEEALGEEETEEEGPNLPEEPKMWV